MRGLGAGSATTLAVAEVVGQTVRTYHVGDSPIWVFGQRGRLKLQTVPHSPVGSICYVTGQGTVGLEFEDQTPDLDTVLVAVGGGGLIGGMLSSTLLTLVVLPALYRLAYPKQQARA